MLLLFYFECMFYALPYHFTKAVEAHVPSQRRLESGPQEDWM